MADRTDAPRPPARDGHDRSEIVHEALPTDDPKVRRPDISLAQQMLDWQPKVGLHEGLQLTLERAGIEQLIGVG